MQLISSSCNNVKTIRVNPIPVRELDEHKIQKNKKVSFVFAEMQMSIGLVQRPRYRHVYWFLVICGWEQPSQYKNIKITLSRQKLLDVHRS